MSKPHLDYVAIIVKNSQQVSLPDESDVAASSLQSLCQIQLNKKLHYQDNICAIYLDTSGSEEGFISEQLLMVPDYMQELVIGNGWRKIMDIETETECNIDIDMPSHSSHWIFKLTGTRSRIYLALDQIN